LESTIYCFVTTLFTVKTIKIKVTFVSIMENQLWVTTTFDENIKI